jgi:hypothetical protein
VFYSFGILAEGSLIVISTSKSTLMLSWRLINSVTQFFPIGLGGGGKSLDRQFPHASTDRHLLQRRLTGRAALQPSPIWRLAPVYSQSLRRAFHSQLESASSSDPHSLSSTPQTLTEKIVQRYAIGLAPGKKVRSGNYISRSPTHLPDTTTVSP